MVQNSLLFGMYLGLNPSERHRTGEPQIQACKFINLPGALAVVYKSDSPTLNPLPNWVVHWRKFPETLTWDLRCLVSCLQRGRMWHSDASTADWQENPLGQEQEPPLENSEPWSPLWAPLRCSAFGLGEQCKLLWL